MRFMTWGATKLSLHEGAQKLENSLFDATLCVQPGSGVFARAIRRIEMILGRRSQPQNRCQNPSLQRVWRDDGEMIADATQRTVGFGHAFAPNRRRLRRIRSRDQHASELLTRRNLNRVGLHDARNATRKIL